ncbi:MAG: HNH endonuclease [Microbacteriaceae bacterium]
MQLIELTTILRDFVSWAVEQPVFVFAAAVTLIGVAVLLTPPRPPMGRRRDPVRLYSSMQRTACFARCGQRCEGETVLGIRCARQATQGDHWFPHSKGGATNARNLVGLCSRCNRRKSAHTPSRARTLRLIVRRRRYWPQGEPRSAGDWY